MPEVSLPTTLKCGKQTKALLDPMIKRRFGISSVGSTAYVYLQKH